MKEDSSPKSKKNGIPGSEFSRSPENCSPRVVCRDKHLGHMQGFGRGAKLHLLGVRQQGRHSCRSARRFGAAVARSVNPVGGQGDEGSPESSVERLAPYFDYMAESLAKGPEFLRLMLMVALERQHADPSCSGDYSLPPDARRRRGRRDYFGAFGLEQAGPGWREPRATSGAHDSLLRWQVRSPPRNIDADAGGPPTNVPAPHSGAASDPPASRDAPIRIGNADVAS